MSNIQLLHGDCLELMAGMEPESVDTIITDPPYGLSKQPDIKEVMRAWLAEEEFNGTGGGFMNQKWDSFVPGPRYWKEALRVLKPGGMLLCFAGTRTADLMGMALRFAGFEIKDTLMYLFGSGFPKSLSIGKAIDRMHGKEREVVGMKVRPDGTGRPNKLGWAPRLNNAYRLANDDNDITAPATPDAELWEGWGSALKPAYEPILLCMKPLDGTYAENALKHSVAGLNIDGARVAHAGLADLRESEGKNQHTNYRNPNSNRDSYSGDFPSRQDYDGRQGRWPANIILDGSDEVVGLFPETTSGKLQAHHQKQGIGLNQSSTFAIRNRTGELKEFGGDSGSAARYFQCCPQDEAPARCFYTAKASRRERDAGLEGMEAKQGHSAYGDFEGTPEHATNKNGQIRNTHPTCKPVKLMEYLCKLTRTPTGGVVLDPFVGSGTTMMACVKTDRDGIGIDTSEEYIAIAEKRVAWAQEQAQQMPLEESNA